MNTLNDLIAEQVRSLLLIEDDLGSLRAEADHG